MAPRIAMESEYNGALRSEELNECSLLEPVRMEQLGIRRASNLPTSSGHGLVAARHVLPEQPGRGDSLEGWRVASRSEDDIWLAIRQIPDASPFSGHCCRYLPRAIPIGRTAQCLFAAPASSH